MASKKCSALLIVIMTVIMVSVVALTSSSKMLEISVLFENVHSVQAKETEVPVPSEERSNVSNKKSEVPKDGNPSCQLHVKNLNIYMDSFKWLDQGWMTGLYTEYIHASQKCPPLPGGGICKFVVNDKYADGIMFYGTYSDLNFIKQHPNQIVISLTMEQEGGPFVRFPPNFHQDVKVSYVRTANVPIPFVCERERALKLYNKGQPQIPKDRKKILGMISNCKAEWRNEYIEILMQHAAIDQLGRCYSGTLSQISKTRRSQHWEYKKMAFLRESQYKYILAFENNVASDYVTEKVFHGLLTGIIPIYYGDRSVFDYIPGNHTIIFAPDFTPKQLAAYINQIDNDEELYASFFKDWDLKKMLTLHEQYCYDHFMCRVCKKALEVRYHQEGCTKVKLMEHGDH